MKRTTEMSAVSIRVYENDRERWRKLITETDAKANKLFASMIEASRAMSILRSLMSMRDYFLDNYKSEYKDEDILSINIACDVLMCWITSPESSFDNVLEYNSDKMKKNINKALELLNFEGNEFYEEFKNLVNKFRSWIKDVDSALSKLDNIKSKLSEELPQSFIEEASILECLDKYRLSVLDDKYMTTTGVLNYIERE